jgi:hypothetical protein
MHWTTKLLARSLPVVVVLAWTSAEQRVAEPAPTAAGGSETSPEAAALPEPVQTEVLAAPAVARSAPRLADDISHTGQRTARDPDDVALVAYQRAATIIDAVDRSCRLDWTLLAAVGQVESFHGEINGSQLDDEGVARPGIIGIALDGSHGTRAIRDSDGGQLDGDLRWDRAVGPMQFIPSTWSIVGVDGDDDGRRNPQDIDDAALAAAVYLCAGDENLSTDAGRTAALLTYNASRSYAATVSALADAFAARSDLTDVLSSVATPSVTLPTATLADVAVAPLEGAAVPPGRRGDRNGGRDGAAGDTAGAETRGGRGEPGDAGTDGPTPLAPGAPAPTSTPTPTPPPTPTPTPTPTPSEPAPSEPTTPPTTPPTGPPPSETPPPPSPAPPVDTDGDGLSDELEAAIMAALPTTYDSDGDGDLDGLDDSDGDLVSNADEVAAGTSPLLP